MRFVFSTLFLLAAGLATAQKPSFDVASVKPAAPQEMGRIMMRVGGDPGMVDYKSVSLRLLLTRAFGVKDYQIVGPDWMSTAMFDVQARLPPETSEENRRLMFQTLLEERFGLKFHKETKDAPIYSLVVAKNGPKLTPAKEAPPNALKLPDSPGYVPPPNQRPAGPPSAANMRPGMMMMRVENGRFHLVTNAMNMSGICDMLSRQVGRPVIDDTGLTGYYDFDIEFKPEPGAMRGLLPPKGGDEGPAGGGPAPESVEAPSIFTAVQDQLGLKLEPKRGPIETIVVDHIEKTPIEN